MPLTPWKILSSSYPLRTKWVTIRQDTCELPDGSVIDDYFVREGSGVIKIFAITPDNKVIINRQYKHGAAAVVTELPAGAIEPGEAPEQAAIRELREETGYVGEAPEIIGHWYFSPTSTDSIVYVALVRNAEYVGGELHDPREEIENELVPVDELAQKVFSGEVNSDSSVAAILYTLQRLG